MVLALIDEGADMNAQNHDGKTALMTCIDEGHSDVAHFLLSRNVGMDVRDKHGYTALIRACHKGRRDIALALIDAGADVLAKSTFGITALLAAERHEPRQDELVQALLERGASRWTQS